MALFKIFRKYYWLTGEFLKRHYKTIIIATLSGIALVAVVSYFAKYIPTPKKNIRIARVGKNSPTSIPEDIQKLVSNGLIQIDLEGDLTPEIASNWKISDDGLTYTFTIDKSLKWHDGSRIKPQDIVYNFKEVEEDYTDNELILHLKEPFAPLMSILSKPILKNNTLGVGKYKITNLKSNAGVLQSITLISDNEKIIYKFYPTENLAITAFKLGEVDRIENLSYLPEDLKRETRLKITQHTDNNKITALFFNNNDSVLSGKSARQGLAYAIEDKLLGHEERAISPISKNSWGYNPNVKTYDYNSARAKELFEQDVENPSDTTIEIKTTLQYLEEAEIIAQSWQNTLGIQTDVKVTTDLTDDYQAILVDYAPPIDPDQYTIWHSTQSTNFTHYQNLKIDKLLEDGRRTLDTELRIQIYEDFQRFLLEDSPAVFLFYTSTYNIERIPLF